MACTSVTISGSPIVATKELHREPNGLRRSQSCKDLCDRAGMRRSPSDPQLRCSLNPVRASSSSEQRVKNGRSLGIVPFPFSGSVFSDSLRSLLFDSDTSKDMRLVDSEEIEGEGETEKRANWIERLMEVRTHWVNNRKKDGEGEEEDADEYCGVDYDTDNEEEELVFDRETFFRFLDPVPWSEAKIFSQLAFLCNMAYVIPELKAEDLRKYYDLHFVTSSLEKKAEAAGIKAKLDHDSVRVPEPEASPVKFSSEDPLEAKLKRPIRPSVAYEIAASAASYVHSRAKGLLSLGSVPQEENEDVDPRGSSEPLGECGFSPPSRVHKSEVAAYVAASTMTAVVAAEETAKQEAARDLRSLHSSPCEWFVCDDPATCTRCFVIQGSDSLASWQANLFFEPTKFEGTEVLVHRGIYEAAKGIYEQFMPEIMNYLRSYGDRARLRFTGHSLGGSLSLLVNLMLLARGVVKPSTLLPVVTFGSPFVFCGGHRILADLGLDEGHLYSVMMHRDIVPRAFSCSYPNHVAQLLKRLNGAFRSHPCLNSNKLLYSPLGQLFILQPDDKSSPPHPFLPPGSALYAFDKSQSSGIASALSAFLNTPHPLETLSDPTAYGSDGTILRDHDSSNYLKAINSVLRQHTKWVVRRSRRQRLHHWWPLLTAPPHSWSQERVLENSGLVTKEVVTGV